ncbi:MAG: hypothetical protein ACYDGR_05675 [Candidatus Dormibacteria bacterium]
MTGVVVQSDDPTNTVSSGDVDLPVVAYTLPPPPVLPEGSPMLLLLGGLAVLGAAVLVKRNARAHQDLS